MADLSSRAHMHLIRLTSEFIRLSTAAFIGFFFFFYRSIWFPHERLLKGSVFSLSYLLIISDLVIQYYVKGTNGKSVV